MIEMDFFGIFSIPKSNGDKAIDLKSQFFYLILFIKFTLLTF